MTNLRLIIIQLTKIRTMAVIFLLFVGFLSCCSLFATILILRPSSTNFSAEVSENKIAEKVTPKVIKHHTHDIDQGNKELDEIADKIREIRLSGKTDIDNWNDFRILKGSLAMKQVFDLLTPHRESNSWTRIRQELAELRWEMQWKSVEEAGCNISPFKSDTAEWWDVFYHILTPTVDCEISYRAGHHGDGGKRICNPHKLRKSLDEKLILYSFGSWDEIAFDFEMTLFFDNIEVHTFDPTTSLDQKGKMSIYHKTAKPGSLNGHLAGIGNGQVMNNIAMKPLRHHANSLGHKKVDIIKMDIEGTERSVMPQIFGDGNILGELGVKILLVEYHAYEGCTCSGFRHSFYTWIKRFYDAGYYMYYHEANQRWFPGGEFAFIRKDLI